MTCVCMVENKERKKITCFIDFECDRQNYTNLYEIRNVYRRWPYVADLYFVLLPPA